MKKTFLCLFLICLAGCGYSSKDSESIGQIKKVSHRTPILCPNYYAIDLSMGIMRGGTGSMSSQDEWFTVEDTSMLPKLKEANESGALVKLKYDEYRWTICVPTHVVTAVEIVK